MISALLISFLPTLLFYILLPKIGLHLKSTYLRIAFAWFTGIYIFSMGAFLLAHVFSLGSVAALPYASYTTLLIVLIAIALYPKRLKELFEFFIIDDSFIKQLKSFDTVFILFCFFFSVFFFSPHLFMNQNAIYQSPIYWDFHWHVGIIQNFAYGNNFPPQNESFSGVPMTYHYFGDFVIAIYESVGLSLTQAINFVSTLAFLFLFITIVGVCQELFHRKSIGYLAVLFTMTSSSWRFISDFQSMKGESIFEMIGHIFANTSHPFNFSFLPGESIYNGTMFNLFYYLEERHIIFGPIYLLLAMVILYKRKTIPPKWLFVSGLLLGTFFFWHIYITAMVFIAALCILLFDGDRKKTLLLLTGFFLTLGPQYSFTKETLANPQWFYQNETTFPRFNPTFATGGHYHNLEAMIQLTVAYFTFAYGLKLLFFIISMCIIWRKNKSLAKVLLAIIIPTFIMINTLEISPQGIADNHKLLLPMNVLVNVVAAFSVWSLFFQKKTWMRITLGGICVLLLTLGGIIELMPFLNSKPTDAYAQYGKNSLTQTIRRESKPRDVFLVRHIKEAHLAGRRLFIGPSAGPIDAFNKEARDKTVKRIYEAKSFADMCKTTKGTDITWVEFYPEEKPQITRSKAVSFSARDDNNRSLIYINVVKSCKKL
jgi:hypothetical protein